MSAIIKEQSCKRGIKHLIHWLAACFSVSLVWTSLPWGGPQILKTKHMVGTFWCPSDQHAFQTLHCSPVPSYMVFPLSVALLPTFTFSLSHYNINWRQKCQNKSVRKWTRSFETNKVSNKYSGGKTGSVTAGCLCASVRGTLGASCSKIQECGLIWEEDVIYWLNKDILTVKEA